MLEIRATLEGLSGETLRARALAIYETIRQELETKPASTRYHHREAGGLGQHIKEVMNIALEVYEAHPEWYRCTRDDVIITAFVHDFNKLGRYVSSESWQKQPKYGAVMFQVDKAKMAMAEAAETVMRCAEQGLILTPLQVNAVSYHHGGWSDGDINGGEMSPLAILLHLADMVSSFVMGRG